MQAASPAVIADAPSRRLPLIGLLVAQVIAAFGNSLTNIAIPWFVLETTGLVGQTGLVAAASVIPMIISTAMGGAAVDRFGYRRMSIVSDGLSMLSVAAIPLAYLTVGLNLPTLIALVFLGALFDAPGSTARTSMQPELAKMAGISLERANGLTQGVGSAALLSGPVLGGILIGVIGASNVLWVNAGTFVLSILIVWLLVPVVKAEQPETQVTTSYLDEVKEGWQFVFNHPLIRSIVSVAVIINFATTPVFALLLPAYANQVLESSQVLGVLLSALGGGTLVGIALYSWLGERLPRRPLLIIGIASFAVLVGAFATGLPWPVLAALMALTGLISAPLNPIVFTIAQQAVPIELRGRVMGAMVASAVLAAPIGLLLAGAMVEAVGLERTFAGGAAILVIATVLATLDRPFRELPARSA